MLNSVKCILSVPINVIFLINIIDYIEHQTHLPFPTETLIGYAESFLLYIIGLDLLTFLVEDFYTYIYEGYCLSFYFLTWHLSGCDIRLMLAS